MSLDERSARELVRLQQLARRVRDCIDHVNESLAQVEGAADIETAHSHLRGSAHTFTEAALRLLLLV